MENFYKELPEEYVLDKVIDAKEDMKIKVIFTVGSFIIFAVVLAFFLPYLIDNYPVDGQLNDRYNAALTLMLSMVVYVVLHELTHGVFYKIFTREKLTFGLTLTVAYCGVPNLYLKKVPAIVSALAPFVVFSIVFGVPLFFITNYWTYVILAILFSLHFSGCIGDLYVSILLIFKYKGKNVLVNDTGPKQTFYIEK